MNISVFVPLCLLTASLSLFAAYRPTIKTSGPGAPGAILLYAAFAAPAIIFFLVWSIHTINIPYQDDIDAILQSTAVIAQGKFNLTDFWQALSTQDDERRIVVVRLAACLLYWTTGAVDFRLIALAGICSYLVFIRLIFAWARPERDLPLVLLLPIPYLLFSNFNYAALYQAMVPLQHIAVYIWGFTCIWLISRKSRFSMLTGGAMGILAVYSDVTGIFIGPVVALMLLAQRQWFAAMCWILVFGIITLCYFTGLQVPDFRPTTSQNLSSWRNLLLIAVAMPGMIVDVCTEASDRTRILCAVVAGIFSLGLVGSSAFVFIKRLRKCQTAITPGQWWLAGCITFLLITFLAFAFGRAAYGAQSILLSRYKHMFVFWAILNYLLALQWPTIRNLIGRYLLLLQISALVYLGASYFQTWGDMRYLRKVIQSDAYGWTKNREFPSAPIYIAIQKTVDDIFEKALESKVYQFPDLPFDDLMKADVRGSSKIMVRTTDFIIVSTKAVSLPAGDGMFLLIHSEDETHVLPMRMFRNSFSGFLRTGQYYSGYCESLGMLRQYLTKDKNYQLTIGVISGQKHYLLTTGERVTG